MDLALQSYATAMAEGRLLRCSLCGFSVRAWSDGNPYYRDERGRKQYAYHPDHENLARCIGNDVPHICLACGSECKVDSLKPRTKCRKCKVGLLVELTQLDGQHCPLCKQGVIVVDPNDRAIS